MTEREKRIEEMAIIARDTTCYYNCSECLCKCEYYDAAEMLYDAGYRKADEVEKETARKILHRLWKMLPYKDDPKASGTDLFWIETIEKVADDFGVEVEE